MEQTKKENGNIEIKIVFDRVLRFDVTILVAAKVKTLPISVNQEEAHNATLEGQISKKVLHQVTGHAGHQLMTDTAKYYGVQITGVVMKCLSCSLEKMRQKNIPKKNENTATKPGERMYLDISSIKDERFSGRKHWAMLVDKATKYKHNFILKKKLDQIEMISSWLRGLKDKYKIQGAILL